MARVDVVVPCYNYGRFLEGCVRSVLEQSLGDVRVLIIDDASSDNSLSVARKLAHDDQRKSALSHTRKTGVISVHIIKALLGHQATISCFYRPMTFWFRAR